jgi:RHS repeat-associated protein
VTKLLNGAGQIEERYEYGDFGFLLDGTSLQPLAASAVGNPRFYTGREHDWETGFHQHRKRYMDPGVGRFTTRDPIGIWGDKLNLGNGYTYAANNPWTLADRTGLWSLSGMWDSAKEAASSAGEFCKNAAAGAIDGAISGVTLGLVETTIGADLLGADTDSLAYQGGKIVGEVAAAAALNSATGGCAGAARVVAIAGRAVDAIDAVQTVAATVQAVKDGDLAAVGANLGGAVLGHAGRGRGKHGDGPDTKPVRDGRPEHCGAREGGASTTPKGGTYKLKDPETGEVRRTGQTNDLGRREKEHLRGEETKDLKLEIDRRTDDPAARRGREQVIHDEHPEARVENGGLNKRNPIADDNPKRDEYLEAGSKL